MTYKLQTVLKIHDDWIKSLDIDPYSALLASSSMDNTVKITDMGTKQLLATIPQRHVCEEVKFGQAHPYIFCASLDGLTRCYDLVDREFIREYYGHGSSVLCLDTKENRLLSGSADRTAKVWDIRTRDAVSTLRGHRTAVSDVVFGDGVMYSCSMDGVVGVWDDRCCGEPVTTVGSNIISMCVCGTSLVVLTRREIFVYENELHREPVPVMESMESLERYDDSHYIVGGRGCVALRSKGSEYGEIFRIMGSASSVKTTRDRTRIICGGVNKTIEFLEKK